MNRTKRAKIMIAALSVAGAVTLGATAFTATGLTNGAGPTQFVGGEITQQVTGAALTQVTYAYNDPGPNTNVKWVDLVFNADSAGRTLTVKFLPSNEMATVVSDDDADPGPAAVSGKIGLETYGARASASGLTGVTGITVTVS